MANELTTVADAKVHLGIPVATVTEDAILTRFVGEASKAIEAFLDRKIIKRTYTDHQDGRNSNRILLRNFPADKPSDLRIDFTSVFTDTETIVDTADYAIDTTGNEVLLINRMFPKGTRNIQIIYDAGYTTVPEDIAGACLWLVGWYYDFYKNRHITNSSKSKNNESVKIMTDWPEWLSNQLMPYKRGPLDWIANAPVSNL